MKNVAHHRVYSANNPFCIYERKLLKKENNLYKREVRGVCFVNSEQLNEGDVVWSQWLSENTADKIEYWRVLEVKERFTPKGNFKMGGGYRLCCNNNRTQRIQ